MYGLARYEADVTRLHLIEHTVNFHIEGTFKEDECLVLIMMDKTAGFDSGRYDVFEYP